MTRFRLLLVLVLLAAALAYTAITDSYGVFLVATTALTAIACIGLNVLLGLAGQVSLGHVGFIAIGAYTTGLLMESAGWFFWATIPASMALAALVGGILSMPALRVRGPYLAMVTIAFGFIVEHGAVEWRDLTGGGNGLILTASPTLFGMPLGERGIAILGVCLVAAALVLFDRLKESGWGFAMRAARDTEVAARSIGIDLVWVRTAAFMISAAAAALGGSLFAPLNGYISPSSFPFLQSILLLLAVMIGGSGTTFGPVIGAAVVVLLPELLADLAEYRLLVFGGLLLAVLRLAPLGIAGTAGNMLGRFLPTGADTEIGTATTAPYSVNWNSGTTANGAATLTATAFDAFGNSTTSPGIQVTVANVPDTTVPTVTLTAPAAGNVTGTVTVSADAADNVGVAQVEELGGDEYLVTVAWQGLAPISAPPASVTCGQNTYNTAGTACVNDLCRRVVTTVVRIPTLS